MGGNKVLSDRKYMELDNQRLERLLRESVARESDRCEELNETQQRLAHALARNREPQSLDDVIHNQPRRT